MHWRIITSLSQRWGGTYWAGWTAVLPIFVLVGKADSLLSHLWEDPCFFSFDDF